MIRRKVPTFFAIGFVLLASLSFASSTPTRDGGSTGHGPTAYTPDAVSRLILRASEDHPRCTNVLGFSHQIDLKRLSTVKTSTVSVVFSSGAAILDGIFVPTYGEDYWAEVACAMLAYGGLEGFDIGECRGFVACLEL